MVSCSSMVTSICLFACLFYLAKMYNTQIRFFVCFFSGQYSPEKFHPPHERSEPSFTFGKRTKILFKDPTPSPNSYSLPPLIGPKGVNKASAPAYSLSGRSAIGGFSEDLKKVNQLLFIEKYPYIADNYFVVVI